MPASCLWKVKAACKEAAKQASEKYPKLDIKNKHQHCNADKQRMKFLQTGHTDFSCGVFKTGLSQMFGDSEQH